ncbi:MAG: hypothetical protein GY869_01085, partial [Planctomycetes bacterium]|nr:hypothetical protein [Planctomycetota bacterium]
MKRQINRVWLLMLFLVLVGGTMAWGQNGADKKALTFEDYGKWRSVSSTGISEDGKWVTYAYAARSKDGTMFIKNLESDKVIEVERGSGPQFSDDNQWIAYTINPPVKKPGQQPAASAPATGGQRGQRGGGGAGRKVELYNLASGDKYSVDNLSSFSFTKGSKFFIVRKSGSGSDLLLRNLETGMNELIGNVSQFAVNKPGNLLAYTVSVDDKAGNGIYLIDLETGIRRPLDTDKADYARMVWEEEGKALAVLKGKEKEGFTRKENVLVMFKDLEEGKPGKIEYDPSEAFDFPKDMVVSELTGISWNPGLDKVFFGIKEQEKKEEEDKDAEEEANVDIWHWQDDRIQSVQMLQASRDRNFTYQGVFNLDTKRFVRLTDEKMKRVTLTRDGNWGIGQDSTAYISDWKPSRADYYRVNVNTGERTLIFEAHKRTMGLSPDSKHYLYWKDGNVWDYVLATGAKKNLTRNARVDFANEDFDHPGEIPPYGVTGWSKDEKSVILTHKYDLYVQPLDGGRAKCLTNGEGDKNEIRFRYQRLDREERFIDLKKPMMLTAYGQWTKKAGFYELKNGELEQLIFEDKSFGGLTKAKKADKFLFTIQTFVDFPDY